MSMSGSIRPEVVRTLGRASTVYPYPNAWRSPYSMELNAEYCRRWARRWLVGVLAALVLDLGYAGAALAGWLAMPDAILFGTATTMLGTAALVRCVLNRTKAQRMDEVRGIWKAMFDAPHSWRALALSRQAYAYCEQDDAVRLIAVAGIAAVAGVGLLVLGVFAVAGMVIPGAHWLYGALGGAMLGGTLYALYLRQRASARRTLAHVLGPRENRPPDMRLSPQRYWS